MKKIHYGKRLVALVLALFMVFTMMPSNAVWAKSNKIRMSKSKLSMQVGQKKTLKLKKVSKKQTKKIKWKSSKKKVASVSKKGVVTAKSKGKATITAKYKGKKYTCKITVKAKNINGCTVSPIANQTYTGRAITPAVTVKNGSIVLKAGKDYTVTYSGNVNAGTAQITIKGMKNYSGQKVVTFRIVRPANANNTANANNNNSGQNDKKDTEKNDPVEPQMKEVQSVSELKQALAGDVDPSEIRLTTNEKDITIDQDVVARNTTLYVNAPNATVTNHGMFSRVVVEQIAENTWVEDEKAEADATSEVLMQAQKGHVVIMPKAKASLVFGGNAKDVKLTNNGSVVSVRVDTKLQLAIEGETKYQIPLMAGAGALDSLIKTEIPLNVNVVAKLELMVLPGAENGTIVTASDNDAIPQITGLGVIEVRIGDELRNVMADESDDEKIAACKGSLTGKVVELSGTKTSTAKAYLLPYPKDFSEENLDQYKGKWETAVTEGDYAFNEIPYGNYLLMIKDTGYETACQMVTLAEESMSAKDILILTPEEAKKKGSITGIVQDSAEEDAAGNLIPVEGATINVRKGSHNMTGEIVATTDSDSDGRFTISDLPYGIYCVQVFESGFMTGTYDVTLTKETQEIQVSLTGTIKLVTGKEVQFILHWDKEGESENVCADLDSHLVGPTADGKSKFHIYYSDQEYIEDDVIQSDLDHDDTEYEGPETTTIRVPSAGIYHFYVNDYCHADSEYEGETLTNMTNSHPWVEVKQGDSTRVFNIPTGSEGTLWEVCTFDSVTGRLETVGTVEYPLVSEQYFGLKSNVEIINSLIKTAEEIGLADNEEFKELKAKINTAKGLELHRQVSKLRDLIRTEREAVMVQEVTSATADRINVTHPGDYDIEGNGEITVYTFDGKLPEDLQIEVKEGSKWEMKASDDPDYEKMIVVSCDSRFTKYYIRIEMAEVIELLKKTFEDGNIIGSTDVCSAYDSDDEEEVFLGKYVEIVGRNEKLTAPRFVFSREEITASYTAGEYQAYGSSYDGKLIVKVGTYSKTYPVRYIQNEEIEITYDQFRVKEFKDKEKVLPWEDYDTYTEGEDEDSETYRYWYVYGTEETLSPDVEVVFDTEDFLKPDSVSKIQPSDNPEIGNYMFTYTVGGKTIKDYIKYSVEDEE